jgi:Homeodomain-like domain
MRHPPIHEEVAALKERLPHAHNSHKKPRLQRLSLLASGQAHTRQDVAPLLGVHRHTLGRWLALYAAGGLDVLLATSVPAGKPVSLAPAVCSLLGRCSMASSGSMSMGPSRSPRANASSWSCRI